MTVRCAQLGDLNTLLEIEATSWNDDYLRMTEEEIVERISQFPQGQLIVVSNGRVVGALYTRITMSSLENLQSSRRNSLPHEPSGQTLQLISIAVDNKQCPNAGQLLRSAAMDLATTLQLCLVVAITRCSKFAEQSGDYKINNFADYVKQGLDPTLYFHLSGGATIRGLVPHYRDEDVSNIGYGVLVQYPLPSSPRTPPAGNILLSEVLSLRRRGGSGMEGEANVDVSTPILDIIDSIQLLQFHQWLSNILLPLGIEASVDILFRFPTCLDLEQFIAASMPKQNPNSLNKMEASNKPRGHNPRRTVSPASVSDTLHQSELRTTETNGKIAIVAVGMVLPGNVDSLDKLHDSLMNQKTYTQEVPDSRWFKPLVAPGSAESYGCFLDDEDIQSFTPSDFGISDKEAANVDPHHRIMMRCVKNALASLGQDIQSLRGNNVGVWVGLSNSDFQEIDGRGLKQNESAYAASGVAMSMAAGRLSFMLGVTGPSIVVDTACSSSLVALHQACNALRLNECDHAIVASANLILAPWLSKAYSNAGMLSPSGQCHTFDERADGYCRGEGAGAFILYPLEIALERGLPVIGVIEGSNVKHHGRGASLTAPNPGTQEDLLTSCVAKVGLTPRDLVGLQAHGTGTKLGDPVELAAIASVFGGARDSPLVVHCAKANFGHLEAASGMLGLLSVLSIMQTRRMPAQAKLQTLSRKVLEAVKHCPNLQFPVPAHLSNESNCLQVEGGDFELPVLQRWCVNSFGFSGTISCMIISNLNVRIENCVPSPVSSDPNRLCISYTYGPKFQAVCGAVPEIRDELLQDDTAVHDLCKGSYASPLLDHTVNGTVVVPGAFLVDLMIADGLVRFPETKCVSLKHVRFWQPHCVKNEDLHHPPGASTGVVKVKFANSASSDAHNRLSVTGLNGLSLAVADIQFLAKTETTWPCQSVPPPSIASFKSAAYLYEAFSRNGLALGPQFQTVTAVAFSDARVDATIQLPQLFWNSSATTARLNPILLDAVFQVCGFLFYEACSLTEPNVSDIFIPGEIEAGVVANNFSNRCDADSSRISVTARQCGELRHSHAMFTVMVYVDRPAGAELLMTFNKVTIHKISPSKMLRRANSANTTPMSRDCLSKSCETQYSVCVAKLQSIALSTTPTVEAIECSDIVGGVSVILNRSPQLQFPSVVKSGAGAVLIASARKSNEKGVCVAVLREQALDQSYLKHSELLLKSFLTSVQQEVPSSFRGVLIVVIPCADASLWFNKSLRSLSLAPCLHTVQLERDLAGICLLHVDSNCLGMSLARFESVLPRLLRGEQLPRQVDCNVLVTADNVHVFEMTVGMSTDGTDARSDATASQWRLHVSSRGHLDNLLLETGVPLVADELGDNDVEVRVTHASLNFRDVLNVLGMYPGDPGQPGCEFSGVVTKVGSKVLGSDVCIGDRVIALQEGTCCSHVRLAASKVVVLPESISLVHGSILPVVYATAHLALQDIAKLTSNDIVLIHTAAGGVGQAALWYAKQVGATIIGTTGSAKKETWLRSQGVEHICSSRNAKEFKDELEQVIQDLGRRPTVVINTLSREFAVLSLESLSATGTFIELGKRGVLTLEEASSIRESVHYECVAIDTLAKEQSTQYVALLRRVCDYLLKTAWPGPSEITQFKYQDFRSAFQCLREGNSIGKVVLDCQASPEDSLTSAVDFARDKVFIISGGSGSLGRECVSTVLALGARRVHLLSRNADSIAADARLVHHICDVSQELSVNDALRSIYDQENDDVHYVIHLAGRARDALTQNMTSEDVDETWSAKVHGANHLHSAVSRMNTKKRALVKFVLFSSLVAQIGREGQCAYGAANRMLDCLAAGHHSEVSLPMLSVQWPAVTGTSMVEKIGSAGRDWSISLQEFASTFVGIMEGRFSKSGCNGDVLTVFPSTTWKTLHRTWRDAWKVGPTETAPLSTSISTPDATTAVTYSKDEVWQVVMKLAASHIVGQHTTSANRDVRPNISFMEQGLDSLGATELSASLGGKFGLNLPSSFIFSYSTVEDVVNAIVEQLEQQRAVTTDKQMISETVVEVGALATPSERDVCISGVSFHFPNNVCSQSRLDDVLLGKEVCTRYDENVRGQRAYIDSLGLSSRRKDALSGAYYGAFVDDVELTQALDLFRGLGLSELEINCMDTRQKMAIQAAVEALCDAGVLCRDVDSTNQQQQFSVQEQYRDKTIGVYVGALGQLKSQAVPAVSTGASINAFSATSNALSVVAGRISFLLGLTGPSMTVDTACSSSLVALHLAKCSIRSGECDVAVVVGVNLIDSELSASFASAGMLAPDGKCKSFDNAANGYCRGEGYAALVLQDYNASVFASSKVYAMIRGSSVAQDGKSASLTAPSGKAQVSVMRKALHDAHLNPEDIAFVEAHGTGTKLGDPIEFDAIKTVYSSGMTGSSPLFVASSKANFGHLEACAGMLGIMSALQVLAHCQSYPNALLTTLNDAIAKERPVDGQRRIEFPVSATSLLPHSSKGVNVAVHAFGYSGTIACVVLSEPPSRGMLTEVHSRCGDDHVVTPPDHEEDSSSSAETASASASEVPVFDHHAVVQATRLTVVCCLLGLPNQSNSTTSSDTSSADDKFARIAQQLGDDWELRPLAEIGIDSILATELAHRISETHANADFTPGDVLNCPTCRDLVGAVMEKLQVAFAVFANALHQPSGARHPTVPWFANYHSAQASEVVEDGSVRKSKVRVIVFGGMAQPAASWHKFVQPWVQQHGFDVHIAQLPGRYERFMEPVVESCHDMLNSLCKAMEELQWLDVAGSGSKIVCVGYSSGAALAFECARQLQHMWHIPAQNLCFVSLGGPDRSIYQRWQFLEAHDRSLEAFVQYHRTNMGRMNPHFDMDAAYIPTLFAVIMEVFHRDNATSKSWMIESDQIEASVSKLSCPVLTINGCEDVAVRKDGWSDATTASCTTFEVGGDHFFLFQDPALDESVATTIAQQILK